MLKNKDFKSMVMAAAVLTVAASVCSLILSGITVSIVTLILGVTIITIFIVFTKRRYDDIDELNSYLVRVLAGGEAPNILDQEEGELSLLKTNIYKATTTLNYQKELLTKDKVALANAIADISHQLKTPLTSMMVMNDLLKTEDDREKALEFLQTQSNQLDRMSWLIQTLLKLSKIDAGTITMKPEEISAETLIKEVMKPFVVQMEVQEINYTHVPADTMIRCDINWTIEAAQNIVKNCIEHMTKGGELTVNVDENNIYTAIEIKDTGCGIDKEDIPHIFERFYKGRNAGKDSVGIGLALAKTIITGQHGDIIVESTEGVGTTFSVRFYKTII